VYVVHDSFITKRSNTVKRTFFLDNPIIDNYLEILNKKIINLIRDFSRAIKLSVPLFR